ncbi:MAG: MBL fold metallo-hydrolase [Spirochaetaceae bacterium]|nr:MBL fold metallo-hydrolase [Spirochaetaceae bacterium]
MCRSDNSRDNRYRASIYVEGKDGEKILVDAGPEIRLQAVRAGITRIDAVLLTHSHADHLHGIDDLRPLTFENPIPVYANKLTYNDLFKRFSYIWAEHTQKGGGLPHLNPILVDKHILREGFSIGAVHIMPIPVMHGELKILGWKFNENGKCAVYITDVSKVPYSSYLKARNCQVLIVDALRIQPHATHFSFDEALDFTKKIYRSQEGSKMLREVYLTHICHNHSHKEIEYYCRAWMSRNNIKNLTVSPAYDTMSIEL